MQDKNNTARAQLESFATEGTRSVTGVSKDSNSNFSNYPSDPEVSPKQKHRQFPKAYKIHVLDHWDKCSEPGEKSAILRREWLYSQSVSNWLEAKEYDSLETLRGSMSQKSVAEPAAFERANYMKALNDFKYSGTM